MGLEHPLADVHLTVCPTEPLGLYILGENNALIPHFHIQVIHTDTYNTNIYIQIHTHTYTYIQPAISVERVFCAAVAAARDASAQRYLPRSSPTRLGACSPSAKCVWNAYWLCRGCTLDPPTRAARASAPKRVRGWVSDGRKKWSATCPGVP